MKKKNNSLLEYREICLYCKSYNVSTKTCSSKKDNSAEKKPLKVPPHMKPEDMQCKRYRMSDDAKFAFSEGGIGYLEETPWSEFKRQTLLKGYQRALEEA